MDNTNLVKLFQAYYNWLYSTNGSFYILDDNFDTLKDLDYCPNQLTGSLLSNYLPNSRDLINDLNKLTGVLKNGILNRKNPILLIPLAIFFHPPSRGFL